MLPLRVRELEFSRMVYHKTRWTNREFDNRFLAAAISADGA
jgi:hypothetical protein